MSVSVATASSNLPQTISLGITKMQVFDVAHVSGDTTLVVTGDRMNRVQWAILASSVVQTAAPSISGASVTFTFTDPAATVKGQVILLGI